jgi:hypothetical protein
LKCNVNGIRKGWYILSHVQGLDQVIWDHLQVLYWMLYWGKYWLYPNICYILFVVPILIKLHFEKHIMLIKFAEFKFLFLRLIFDGGCMYFFHIYLLILYSFSLAISKMQDKLVKEKCNCLINYWLEIRLGFNFCSKSRWK